jgi:cyanophycinase
VASKTPKEKAAKKISKAGVLVIIGGREDRLGPKHVLREVVARVGEGTLVVATMASEIPDEQWKDYQRAFAELGLKRMAHLDVRSREEAVEEKRIKSLASASAVLFTGGDQVRLTSRIAGTPIYDAVLKIYGAGGTIAGTSAGASAMSETMLVGGPGAESHKVGGALFTAAGLGLAKDMIIDQHFAQRWRIGRLLGAVAEKPSALGIGIDEDTAIVVTGNDHFEVVGSGAVYIVDGRGVTYTNVSERETERIMAIFDARVHVLGKGQRFDLKNRKPENPATTARTH